VIPDSPPAAVHPAPRPTTSLMLGAGNPEWAHLGVDYRSRHLGGGLSLGTIGLATDLTAEVRWFLWDRGSSPYAELGTTVLRSWPQTDQTPGDWYFLGFVGIGYRWQIGRVLTNLGLGLYPLPLPPLGIPSIFVSNASSLPRLMIQVGYAL